MAEYRIGQVQYGVNTPFINGGYYGDGTIPQLTDNVWIREVGNNSVGLDLKILIDRQSKNVMLTGTKSPVFTTRYPILNNGGSLLYTTATFLDDIAVNLSDWEFMTEADVKNNRTLFLVVFEDTTTP